MLTPDYLDSLPDAAVELWQQVEDDILKDIAERISQLDELEPLTPTAAWQAWRYEQMQACHQDALSILARYSKRSRDTIRQTLLDAGLETLASDDALYRALGFAPSAIDTNETLNNLLNAGYRQTLGAWQNLTATTANTVTGEFERALDRAWLQVSSGAFSYDVAIRRAVDGLAGRMNGVTYPSGHRDTLEVAVRRAVLTGTNQTCAQLQLARAEEIGCEYVEVSAHAGARPEHAVWQGKVYHVGGAAELDGVLYEDFETATGYGTGPGLCGWNCRHSFYPFFPGISKRLYGQEELDRLAAKTVEYGGEKYTEYEITQMQRELERRVRKAKRRFLAEQAAGVDATAASVGLRDARRALNDFIEATGGKLSAARTDVAGFGASEARTTTALAQKQERLDTVNAELNQAAQRGILNPSQDGNGRNPDVNFVCKLDRELYKVVTEDIRTDEVIITDERIQHIQERHPNDYERFNSYLQEIIQEPDYIIRDKRPQTGMVLKEIVVGETNEHFRIALRLAAVRDPANYKNSILTFLKIRESEWERLINNKEILYRAK